MKVLELTLAYRPSAGERKKIAAWVNQFFPPGVKLIIKVNQAIKGGAQVSFDGRWQDLSLQKSLAAALEKRKNEIIQAVS